MKLTAGVLICLLVGMHAATAASFTSFLPQTGLAQYVVYTLDLATISSSLGNRITADQHSFASFGVQSTAVSDDTVELTGDDWVYKVKVLERGDLNRDGVEDVLICFSDQAARGTYSSVKPYLLTKYGA